MPDESRNALSFWFPRLQAAGLPVPRTHLFELPVRVCEEIYAALDGEPVEELRKGGVLSGGDHVFRLYRSTAEAVLHPGETLDPEWKGP